MRPKKVDRSSSSWKCHGKILCNSSKLSRRLRRVEKSQLKWNFDRLDVSHDLNIRTWTYGKLEMSKFLSSSVDSSQQSSIIIIYLIYSLARDMLQSSSSMTSIDRAAASDFDFESVDSTFILPCKQIQTANYTVSIPRNEKSLKLMNIFVNI